MRVEKERHAAALEAILFAMGEPVEAPKIEYALGISSDELLDVVAALSKKYESEDSGLCIIKIEGSYQLCTKAVCFEPMMRIVSQPKKPVITEALLETLAIVAYKQPVMRIEIDKIRGVSCAHTVNRLIEYGLIEEVGRADAPGRPILFGTTAEFLRRFGLESIDMLPPQPEMGDVEPDADEGGEDLWEASE